MFRRLLSTGRLVPAACKGLQASSAARSLQSPLSSPLLASLRSATTYRTICSTSLFRSSSSNTSSQVDEETALTAFAARIGLHFNEPGKLRQALTTASSEGNPELNQERLEAFGDRILNFFVSEHIYVKYPNYTAEQLTDALKVYVNNQMLARVGRKLGLQSMLIRNPIVGDESRGVEKNLADTVEALVAAVYEDQGPKAARDFVEKHVISAITDIDVELDSHYPKRTLNAHTINRKQPRPQYQILAETGRNTHAPIFKVGVFVDEKKVGEGRGRSIRQAEDDAARDALRQHYGVVLHNASLPSDSL